MAWVRIDDAFNDHPKFAAAGPLGIAQWLAGLAYCNRNLTDGFIPRAVAKRLLDWDGVAWRCWQGELMGGGEDAEAIEVSEHLVSVGLWHPVEGGYEVHDYHDFQPSSATVREEREKARERMAKARSGKRSPATSPRTSTEVRPNVQENHNGSSRNPKPVPVLDLDLKIKDSPSADAEDPFEAFWSAYPRKVGKDAARKAFDRRIRGKDRVDANVIAAAAARLADDPNLPEKEFIPHPSTWLARGGWDDEPCPSRTTNGRPAASGMPLDRARDIADLSARMQARADRTAIGDST